jgi:hypothetical protein
MKKEHLIKKITINHDENWDEVIEERGVRSDKLLYTEIISHDNFDEVLIHYLPGEHIEPFTLVQFDYNAVPKTHQDSYPFLEGKTYIYLRDISNMPGHCVVMDYSTHELYSGYHTSNFRVLKHKEI